MKVLLGWGIGTVATKVATMIQNYEIHKLYFMFKCNQSSIFKSTLTAPKVTDMCIQVCVCLMKKYINTYFKQCIFGLQFFLLMYIWLKRTDREVCRTLKIFSPNIRIQF